MTRDWFRSTDWSPAGTDEFERRLARARPHNRAQYLRIKGLSLDDAGNVNAARELWIRVLHDQGPYAQIQGYSALEHLGDSYAADDPARAEAFYRRLMAENPTMNATSRVQHVKLAEVLIARGSGDSLEEASQLLEQWIGVESLRFPSQLFRWNLALIALAEATGQSDVARDAARRALLHAEQGPAFRVTQASAWCRPTRTRCAG